ncbi:MAG: hypothetical protein HOY79_04385 [Streptomyces sp.]|nr:hypothetical protein [Streptomyces sp.]NUS15443.1 hypothetical protein [Streptomyces sp.]NUS24099.1 hypothetical protein [Streptomyces sp.]
MIREEDAKPFENSTVVLTLVDGTTLNGYVSGVGYAGLRLMVKGSEAEWRFGAIESIRASRGWRK